MLAVSGHSPVESVEQSSPYRHQYLPISVCLATCYLLCGHGHFFCPALREIKSDQMPDPEECTIINIQTISESNNIMQVILPHEVNHSIIMCSKQRRILMTDSL
jgi:hypothetical protein